jgi:hypothetical protein
VEQDTDEDEEEGEGGRRKRKRKKRKKKERRVWKVGEGKARGVAVRYSGCSYKSSQPRGSHARVHHHIFPTPLV